MRRLNCMAKFKKEISSMHLRALADSFHNSLKSDLIRQTLSRRVRELLRSSLVQLALQKLLFIVSGGQYTGIQGKPGLSPDKTRYQMWYVRPREKCSLATSAKASKAFQG